MPDASNRRDFLKGKSAALAMGDLIQAALPEFPSLPEPPVPRMGGEPLLLNVSRKAMASLFQVILNVGQYANDAEAALAALDVVESLEEKLSYFRDDSQISRINHAAAAGPVEVEPWLFELLQQAVRFGQETGGAYDVTATALWTAWGFSRRQGRVPSGEELSEARARVGGRFVELDAQRQTVRLLRSGVEISLGSIGKGYALDRAGEHLAEQGIHDFLIHGGQSSVLARGSRRRAAGAAAGEPAGWSIGIHHPLRPGTRIAEVWLRDRALGTSGALNQSFRHRGRRYGHILDPRTGVPAEGVLSATVLAPTAAAADALSTAFYVLGKEPAVEYCRTRPELAAVLLCPSGRSEGLEIVTTGLAPGDFLLLPAGREEDP